jgi:hypothetical protein
VGVTPPGDTALARVEAVRAASGRAWLVGAGVGVFMGFVGAGATVFSVLCCMLQLVVLVVPGVAGAIAGAFGANAPVYRELGAGQGLWVGALLGARSGASAAVFSSLGAGLMWVVAAGAFAATSPIGRDELLIVGGLFGTWGAMGAAGLGLGVLLGAASGAIVGELRQPLVSRELPER